MWRIPCGINVVGLSFFFLLFFVVAVVVVILFTDAHVPFLTNKRSLCFCFVFPPAPNAEVQKLWRRSFRVAGAVTGAPVWAGGPLAFHAVGGAGAFVCHLLSNLQPRPLYQTARPASASPSTDQVATSHLLWLNNQCKKKKTKRKKKRVKKSKNRLAKFWKGMAAAAWFPTRTFRYFKLFCILSLLPMYKKRRNESMEDLVSVAHIQVVVFYLHFQSRQHPSLHYNFCLFILLLYLVRSLDSRFTVFSWGRARTIWVTLCRYKGKEDRRLGVSFLRPHPLAVAPPLPVPAGRDSVGYTNKSPLVIPLDASSL